MVIIFDGVHEHHRAMRQRLHWAGAGNIHLAGRATSPLISVYINDLSELSETVNIHNGDLHAIRSIHAH